MSLKAAIPAALGVAALAAAGCGATSSSSTPGSAQQSSHQTAPQTFNGNGAENLGTIKVPTDSTLSWSEPGNQTGMSISSDLNSDGNDINIDGMGTSGTSAVDAGTYTNVQVDADAAFTITFTPNH